MQQYQISQWEQQQPEEQGSQMAQQDLNQPSPLTPFHDPPLFVNSDASSYGQQHRSPLEESLLFHQLSSARPSSSESTAGPSNSAGTSQLRVGTITTRRQRSSQPYRRPENHAGPSSNTRQQAQSKPDLQIIQHLPPPPSTAPRSSEATPKPNLSPATFSLAPLASDPFSVSQLSASQTSTTNCRSSVLAIRMDWRYDPASRVLKAYLELPGVRQDDIRITLSTLCHTRVRVLTVQAMRRAPFHATPNATFQGAVSGSGRLGEPVAGEDYSYVEGKYGACRRRLIVTPDCTPAHINAHFADGVLVLDIDCGPPDDKNEVFDIPLSMRA
ncbi:hypothetical protein CYLTODRAFT_279912 [Cylindrobasidium torrendii FP15055 ss-10]|uniref:SHSP domain-containing protein n=1 Tax=Cylindrobasidium torrendii FP15055 ss-10 TaxID=1314674 RepID=A0A0D7BCE0_9AGAR|nr:hypothetical protein CYLTODRAFT_279912 [Cylindrobasidium torrendii FP15055 ss-10]